MTDPYFFISSLLFFVCCTIFVHFSPILQFLNQKNN